MLPPDFYIKAVYKKVVGEGGGGDFREPMAQQSTNFQDWGAGPFVN